MNVSLTSSMASGLSINVSCWPTWSSYALRGRDYSVFVDKAKRNEMESLTQLRPHHSYQRIRDFFPYSCRVNLRIDNACTCDDQKLVKWSHSSENERSADFFRSLFFQSCPNELVCNAGQPRLMADIPNVKDSCLGRRLSLVCMVSFLTSGVVFGKAGSSWATEENVKVKYFTNLDDAREEGERRREEKEREQGPIITLPSGVKFRELQTGTGRQVEFGDIIAISFTIYRVNGLYVDSVGYGNEGKDDVGDTFTFKFGSTKMPQGVEMGMQGMRVGGKRRILVRPELGWATPDTQPFPTTRAATRRFANAERQLLLFEMEIVKAKSSN